MAEEISYPFIKTFVECTTFTGHSDGHSWQFDGKKGPTKLQKYRCSKENCSARKQNLSYIKTKAEITIKTKYLSPHSCLTNSENKHQVYSCNK